MIFLGFEINLVWAALLFFSIYMVIFSFLINLLEPVTPKIISDAFGYGKTTNSNLSALIKFIQVPKAYFTHFYIFATLFMGSLWIFTIKIVLLEHGLPSWLDQSLTFLSQESRLTSTTPEAVIIAMTLMNIQCWRRLYECLYINVDTGSKMNILHYIVGFAHYFCCGIGYISEAPGFAQHPENSFVKWIHIQPELTNITLVQLFAIGLFFYAWIHQLEAHKIFASMKRKSSSSHSVPHGDWFKYVSCPHYLAEILIYLSQVMILGIKHRTACLIFGWVLTNQIIAGLMSHWWYRKNFKNYPTNRKAVIPFVL